MVRSKLARGWKFYVYMTTGMAIGELTPSANAAKPQQQLPVTLTPNWKICYDVAPQNE